MRAVVAKSFARIHAANLVNAGILPLTFVNGEDYEKIEQGDSLRIDGLFAALEAGRATLVNETKGIEIPLACAFTSRQIAILKAGGLLPYTKGE